MHHVSRRPRIFAMAVATVGAMATVAASLVSTAQAAPTRTATVTFLHAIPAGSGIGTVDLYSGARPLAQNLAAGDLRTLQLPAGAYDLRIVADGRGSAPDTTLLRAPRARIVADKNITVAAHLNAAGKPTLTQYTNDTRTVGMGMGRLTVRNIAAGSPLDLRLGSTTMQDGLRNPQQTDLGLRAGNYRLDIRAEGTSRRVMAPVPVTITNRPGRSDMGTNSIVYIWGSTADRALQTTTQNVRIDLQ